MKKEKLLKLKALILLGIIPLTNAGCKQNNNVTEKLYPYIEEEQDIKYQIGNNDKFIVLKNIDTNELEYYLTNKSVLEQKDRFINVDYYDILTDKSIYYEFYDEGNLVDKTEQKELIKESNIEDHIKGKKYTKEQLENIIYEKKEQYESKKRILKK